MPSDHDTFRFHEFDVPVPLINMTGGGTDTFEAISEAHINNLRRFIGIEPDNSFLEIGCGIGRDAIPLTKILSQSGKYLGIDIIRPSIDFCTNNIAVRYSNFRFEHFDVKDQLHNPTGTAAMTDYRLPLPDGSVDKVIAWSVFTHMWEKDIRHYLQEFLRVLRPDGAVWATCYVLTPEIVAKARETNLTKWGFKFEHKIDDGCYINDPAFPLGSIGYTPIALRAMVRDSGLRMTRDFVRGSWSGFYLDPEDGQDALVLTRP